MPGPIPFASEMLAIIAIGLLLAGIIKGATGLGYATCALPFLVYAVGLEDAIALVLLPAMATNVAVALGNGHLRETLHDFAPLYLAMLPGIASGAAMLTWVDAAIPVKLLGTSIVAYAAFALLRPGLQLPPRLVSMLQIPVGFSNGVLTGLTGSQVMPLVPYVMAARLAPPRAVQAINLGVMLASAVLLAGLLLAGVVTPTMLALSVAAIAPALLGVEFGQRIAAGVSEPVFRAMVLVVLLIAGLGMLAR